MERDEEPRDPDLVEIRPELSQADNKKLAAIRVALKKTLSKKAVAELIIGYGVEHSAEFLAWYGERAAREVKRLEDS